MNEVTQDGQGNILEEIVDHQNGTGTRRVFDQDGSVVFEGVVDRPIPPTEERARRSVSSEALQKLKHQLGDPELTSISELKSVLKDFIDSIE